MTPDGQHTTSAERGKSNGQCLHHVAVLTNRPNRKLKTLENYKFYLAFENLGVADYVSEKVSESLLMVYILKVCAGV